MSPDPADYPCGDCYVAAGHPCRTHAEPGTSHASRIRTAYLRSLPRGTCRLCGDVLLYGSDPVEVWHPDPDTSLCPPLPDPAADWNAYARARATIRPGYPGLDNYIPAVPIRPDPDLVDNIEGITRDREGARRLSTHPPRTHGPRL